LSLETTAWNGNRGCSLYSWPCYWGWPKFS